MFKFTNHLKALYKNHAGIQEICLDTIGIGGGIAVLKMVEFFRPFHGSRTVQNVLSYQSSIWGIAFLLMISLLGILHLSRIAIKTIRVHNH